MKKIIISYASYGGGHLSAAKNLKEYIDQNYPDCEVFLFDFMRYINRVIDKVCGQTYSAITTNIPWFWGKVYYHTQDPIFEKIIALSNKLLSFKLGRLLKKFNADIIISTHFFAGHMCSILKQKGKISSKIATVITDYGEDPYNEWITGHEYIDYIFVAHDDIRNTLIKKGVSYNKIYVTGIPISSKFLLDYNKKDLYDNFKLKDNKKTVLFFGGGELGLGKSKTLDIFKVLVNDFSNIQVIAIAGKNEHLKNCFEEISDNSNNDSVKILGFTDKVAELMNISNLVITKPGGLTTTECLVSNLPMLVINPIPGQEAENATFLENNGVAVWLKKDDDISLILNSLLCNDENLKFLKNNTFKIAKPNSTKDICNIIF